MPLGKKKSCIIVYNEHKDFVLMYSPYTPRGTGKVSICISVGCLCNMVIILTHSATIQWSVSGGPLLGETTFLQDNIYTMKMYAFPKFYRETKLPTTHQYAPAHLGHNTAPVKQHMKSTSRH